MSALFLDWAQHAKGSIAVFPVRADWELRVWLFPKWHRLIVAPHPLNTVDKHLGVRAQWRRARFHWLQETHYCGP